MGLVDEDFNKHKRAQFVASIVALIVKCLKDESEEKCRGCKRGGWVGLGVGS